jgi:pantoate--beta-alanine ligase
MQIITNIEAWHKLRKTLPSAVGFVPTMGNLHAGHMALCAESMRNNACTVVSIFINQPQFNQADDYNNYPRTLEQDQQLLSAQGVDYLLLPNADELYADNFQMQVVDAEHSQILEGAFRPGHFTGVLTIVLKLLNIVRPERAYFGEKDYQQLLTVQKMVAAFFMDCEIVSCATLRASDGLALSSRNNRLSAADRIHAAEFPRLLKSNLSTQAITTELIKLGFKVDYIAERWGRRLGAVWLGGIRLMDNFPAEDR